MENWYNIKNEVLSLLIYERDEEQEKEYIKIREIMIWMNHIKPGGQDGLIKN